MFHRILYKLAFYETPIIVASIIVAALILGWWLEVSFGYLWSIPVGFLYGRLIYWCIKLGVASFTIGPKWNKCWGAMIELEAKKSSIGGNAMASILFYFPIALIIMIMGGVFHLDFLLWIGMIIWLYVGCHHAFATMPAAILFLGRSSAENNELLWALRLRVFPLRLTSLLDAKSESEYLNLQQRLNDYDNVRMEDDKEWLDVVERLAMVTPIIILDCRDDSDAVRSEIAILNDPMFARKTLAIVGDDGRAAAIDAAFARGVLVSPPPWRLLSLSAATTELLRICRDPKSVASLQISTST